MIIILPRKRNTLVGEFEKEHFFIYIIIILKDQFFAMNSNLKELVLRDNNIGDAGCIALINNLPRLEVIFTLEWSIF